MAQNQEFDIQKNNFNNNASDHVEIGTVKFYIREREFGFISIDANESGMADNGPSNGAASDIFVHATVLQNSKIDPEDFMKQQGRKIGFVRNMRQPNKAARVMFLEE